MSMMGFHCIIRPRRSSSVWPPGGALVPTESVAAGTQGLGAVVWASLFGAGPATAATASVLNALGAEAPNTVCMNPGASHGR